MLSLMIAHAKESVEALTKATTHGKKFLDAGGKHLTHDDALKAAKIGVKDNRVKRIGSR